MVSNNNMVMNFLNEILKTLAKTGKTFQEQYQNSYYDFSSIHDDFEPVNEAPYITWVDTAAFGMSEQAYYSNVHSEPFWRGCVKDDLTTPQKMMVYRFIKALNESL